MIVMDVDLASYSVWNWLRLQPAIHILKSVRYRLIDRQYRTLPARVSALREPDERKQYLLISIGFEDAELIDWQARLVNRYLPSAEYIVVDNSNSTKGAEAIRSVCERLGCGYILTPDNPWHGVPSRSHGLALNWALENVVRPRRPKAFGFIDDDIFPLESTDPFEPLQRQEFYGVVRHSKTRWYLWAGFCFFRFSLAERLPLSFGQAWFLELDTGGANWNVLYKDYTLSALEQMETSFFPIRHGLEMVDAPMQKCGPWIHEVGQMGHRSWVSEKRKILKGLLAVSLDQ